MTYPTNYDILCFPNDPDDQDKENEEEIDVPKPPKKEMIMAFE